MGHTLTLYFVISCPHAVEVNINTISSVWYSSFVEVFHVLYVAATAGLPFCLPSICQGADLSRYPGR